MSMQLNSQPTPEVEDDQVLLADVPAVEINPAKAARASKRRRNLEYKAKPSRGRAEMRRAQAEQEELELATVTQQAYADVMG